MGREASDIRHQTKDIRHWTADIRLRRRTSNIGLKMPDVRCLASDVRCLMRAGSALLVMFFKEIDILNVCRRILQKMHT